MDKLIGIKWIRVTESMYMGAKYYLTLTKNNIVIYEYERILNHDSEIDEMIKDVMQYIKNINITKEQLLNAMRNETTKAEDVKRQVICPERAKAQRDILQFLLNRFNNDEIKPKVRTYLQDKICRLEEEIKEWQ